MMFISVIVLFFTYFQSLNCLSRQDSEISRLNFFDTDLLRYSTEDRKGNIVVSPASIKSILSMVLEGANGITATEIRNALRLSPDKDEFREQLNEYLTMLRVNEPEVTLINTNTMFLSRKINVKKEFVIMLHRVYLSEINIVDFREPISVANIINTWVNNNTKGLISTLVEPEHIDPTTQLLLANTMYFKSNWRHAFDPRDTKGSCFRNSGVCQTVAMMELRAELNYTYVDVLRAHALELPYENSRYSMFLLVPNDQDGVSALLRDLPYMSLPQIVKLMEQSDVQLYMPKFSIDNNEDMAGTLKAMRINTLFSGKADLSGIFNDSSPPVNNIFHKVHVSVDELGTVAAAASSAMVIPLIENGVHIRIDRPFVFFIRDNKQGLILFEGKVEEPTPYVEPKPVPPKVPDTPASQNVSKSTSKILRNPSKRRFYG